MPLNLELSAETISEYHRASIATLAEDEALANSRHEMAFGVSAAYTSIALGLYCALYMVPTGMALHAMKGSDLVGTRAWEFVVNMVTTLVALCLPITFAFTYVAHEKYSYYMKLFLYSLKHFGCDIAALPRVCASAKPVDIGTADKYVSSVAMISIGLCIAVGAIASYTFVGA